MGLVRDLPPDGSGGARALPGGARASGGGGHDALPTADPMPRRSGSTSNRAAT